MTTNLCEHGVWAELCRHKQCWPQEQPEEHEEDEMETGLKDTDAMPFGKYKGKPMQDIPASYLHWLWVNGLEHDKQSDVAEYIRRNMDALKKEHKDGIW